VGDFIKLRIIIKGDVNRLVEIRRRYFDAGNFDYNSLIPMPSDLNVEIGNHLETGYDALFGEWRNVAKQWMLKEPAAAIDIPWPLGSRDEVIRCIEWLDCADFYFGPARAFKRNLEKYGHGEAGSWMATYWGCDCNADKDKVETVLVSDELHVRFNPGSYPKLVLKKLSQMYPSNCFLIRYVNEYDRPGRSFLLQKGKEVEKHKLPAEELKVLVHSHPLNQTWGLYGVS
jgi:hypothetical protein